MKKELLPSILLTIVSIVLLAWVYPAIVWGIAQFAPNKGEGFVIKGKDNKDYYENIGQNFTEDKYFWSRPSAVSYNAAGSGGSNKGTDNPDYLLQVQARIDTFMAHNPGINKRDIPSDLVTASGSGLDPHISVQGAKIQIKRIAGSRGLTVVQVAAIVKTHIEAPMFGMGPERINVLQLNIDLDKMKY
jgi:K+-transporting ATPase ATPase C chain